MTTATKCLKASDGWLDALNELHPIATQEDRKNIRDQPWVVLLREAMRIANAVVA